MEVRQGKEFLDLVFGGNGPAGDGVAPEVLEGRGDRGHGDAAGPGTVGALFLCVV